MFEEFRDEEGAVFAELRTEQIVSEFNVPKKNLLKS